MRQSRQLNELNFVQEYATFADKLLNKQPIYSFLVDQCPGASAQTQEKASSRYKLTQEKHLSERIREISSQPAYFDDKEIPAIIHESEDFHGIMAELEQAFQVQLDKRFFKYDVDAGTCQLYGIRNKLTAYNTQMGHKYTVVYFSKKLDCRQTIQRLCEVANVFVCIKGVYQMTLRNATSQVSNITQTCVLHDNNNIHRVVDDVFQTSGDHILLFDEELFQVATEFPVSELKQRIDAHEAEKREQLRLLQEEEEERLRLEQQRAAMADDDLEFVGQNQPVITGFAEIPGTEGAADQKDEMSGDKESFDQPSAQDEQPPAHGEEPSAHEEQREPELDPQAAPEQGEENMEKPANPYEAITEAMQEAAE